MAKDKITIQIDDEVIELTGEALEAFIADRNARVEESRLLEADIAAKAEAKQSAKTKLAALGLTETEINALIGE